MKNWKSTIIGALLAASDVLLQFLADPKFDFTDWKHYIRPLLLAALGYVVADARKTAQLVILFGTFLLLPSCVTTETTITGPDGTVTHTKTTGPDANSVSAAAGAVNVAGQILTPRIIAEK